MNTTGDEILLQYYKQCIAFIAGRVDTANFVTDRAQLCHCWLNNDVPMLVGRLQLEMTREMKVMLQCHLLFTYYRFLRITDHFPDM